MPVGPDAFKAVLGRFASGVTVVTVATPDGDHGMTASAFCSVSLDPPLVLVCVGKKNQTHTWLEQVRRFGINVLSADQVSVSNRFAGWWDGGDKWADLPFVRGESSGAPLLAAALGTLDCTLHSTADGGDHTIFIGKVHGAEARGERDSLDPLLYFAGGYRTAGPKPDDR